MAAAAVTRMTRMEVVGVSMVPTLHPGDRVLVLRGRRARPGDLVAVLDPRPPGRVVIKRVMAVDRESVTVVGDNPDTSTDSRVFGPVPRRAVRGRALYRYFPGHRTAWLAGQRRSDRSGPGLVSWPHVER